MTSPADKAMRDHVARDLFVQRMLKAPDDPNKQPNATWVAQDALRDADAFILARDDHDKAMGAKPASTAVKQVMRNAGFQLEDDDELAS